MPLLFIFCYLKGGEVCSSQTMTPTHQSEAPPFTSVSDSSISETRDNVELHVDEDMWLITSGGVQLNLNSEDFNRLDGTYDNGWLNDKIIDAAHALLRQEFPSAGGLQSCILACGPTFRSEVKPFVQIVNTCPNGPGDHWILLSTINCPPFTIDVYDSTNSNWLSIDTERSIAKLMRIPLKKRFITVRFPKSPNQRNANDCGVYAIANMVYILNGTNPT